MTALGGCARTIQYDNLKAAVLDRQGSAIHFHPRLLELAGHYHFAPRPCAPARAHEKGKVERQIEYLRHAFFAARPLELEVRENGDVLRAATYGWGMWQRRIRPPVYPWMFTFAITRWTRAKRAPRRTRRSRSAGRRPQVVYFWESPDIKVSVDGPGPKDGVEFDELPETAPLRSVANPLYVQVHNRGWMAATNVKVRALWAQGGAGLPPLPSDFWSTFPGSWSGTSDWQPIDPNWPFQIIPKLMPHTPAILAWSWFLPLSAEDDSCVLVVISADNDPVTRNDATPEDLIVDTVSVFDKHVAHRNLQLIRLPIRVWVERGGRGNVQGDQGTSVQQPYDHANVFEVQIDRGTLPRDAQVAVALSRGWCRGGWPATREYSRTLLSRRDPCLWTCPEQRTPGDAFRFSVTQRLAHRTIGGSTYEVRVPPAIVRISGERPSSESFQT